LALRRASLPDALSGGQAFIQEDTAMDKKNVEGAVDTIKGRVKETLGVATNDRDLEAEGKGDQIKGKVKDLAGDLRQGIKDGLDNLDRKP
jgi:uncharacterized protein YjbJ (UPF0337 family)